MKFKIIKNLFFYQLIFFLLLCGAPTNAQQKSLFASVINVGVSNTEHKNTTNKIAPGEILPVSIELSNFGSDKRVDVIIIYKILDRNNNEVYSQSETVAVETTASFIKRIQLPNTIKPGQYTVVSSLNYPHQESPAVSSFQILVEEKIGGFFKNDLIIYSTLACAMVLIVIILFFVFARRSLKNYPHLHDYSDKPKDQMIYYEILIDIISQMRLRIGNDALEIAKDIPELEINEKNGLVINIGSEPAKIIALLISRYEKTSGKRVSFGLRPEKK